MTRALFVSSSLLLAACGGPLVTADFEAPLICHDLEAIAFPGAPVAVEGTLTFEIPFQLPAELTSDQFETETEVELLSITAVAEGVSDLGFIESAVVTASSDGQPVVLASYEESGSPTTELRLVPRGPIDLRELAGAAPVPLETELTGVLPQTPWTLKNRICHRVRTRSTFTP